jgi:large subunit ribosomal protein L18
MATSIRKHNIQMRHKRIRKIVSGTPERPRLAVHFSGKHIYAQIIDDKDGRTVAAASTLGSKVSGANVDAASQVGKEIAAAAKKAGVTTVVFDRGGFLFHGRVKALAEAAREGGLEF